MKVYNSTHKLSAKEGYINHRDVTRPPAARLKTGSVIGAFLQHPGATAGDVLILVSAVRFQ